jgi:hypothetical protein
VSLSDVANIGTLASAIAVLVSLVYLNIQIRETRQNQRALLNQATATRAVEALRARADPQVADLYARVTDGKTDFTAAEIIQLRFLLASNIAVILDTHAQRDEGMVDDRMVDMAVGGLRAHFARPVFRAIWDMMKAEGHPPSPLIETIIDETPVLPFRDVAADLRRALGAMSARPDEGRPVARPRRRSNTPAPL